MNREETLLTGTRRVSIIYKIIFASFIGVVLWYVYFFVSADIRKILIATPDDASYYFKIADNFSAGKGFTFDGINKTNGFQPLWMYIIIVLQFFFYTSPESFYRFCLIVQIVFLLSSSYLLYSVQEKLFGKHTGYLILLIFMAFVFMQANNGMESALLILMISFLYYYSYQSNIVDEYKFNKNFMFGVLLGFTVLARLDMIFLVISIFLFLLFNIKFDNKLNRLSILRALFILTGFSVILIPYLLYNLLNFNNIQPISGLLKSSFPTPGLNLEFAFTISSIVTIIVSVTAALFYIFRFRHIYNYSKNKYGRFFLLSMGILALSILLHFFYSILFMNWAVMNWHFIYYGVFLSLIFSTSFEFEFVKKMNYSRNIYLTGLSVIVIIILIYKIYFRFNLNENNSWHAASYNAAVWVRNNTGSASIFAMRDAGIFGYFSKRSVINLDGLVNNFYYQNVLKNHSLKKYLTNEKVKYFVQPIFSDRSDIISKKYAVFKFSVFSHLYHKFSDTLFFYSADEFYRSPVYFDKNGKAVFIIWKFAGSILH